MASAANPRASAGDQKPPKQSVMQSAKNGESKKFSAVTALSSTAQVREQHKPFKIKKIQKIQKSNTQMQPNSDPE